MKKNQQQQRIFADENEVFAQMVIVLLCNL